MPLCSGAAYARAPPGPLGDLAEHLPVVNLPAVEAICRRIYGLLLAFEDVHGEADWKKPRQAGGSWRSKVKWQLLQEYGVRSLDSSEWHVAEADQEVSERLERRALFNKHLSEFSDSAKGKKGGEDES